MADEEKDQRRVGVRMPGALYRQVLDLAWHRRLSVNRWIVEAIEEAVEAQGPKAKKEEG